MRSKCVYCSVFVCIAIIFISISCSNGESDQVKNDGDAGGLIETNCSTQRSKIDNNDCDNACAALAECGEITNLEQCMDECKAASETEQICACSCFTKDTCQEFGSCFKDCLEYKDTDDSNNGGLVDSDCGLSGLQIDRDDCGAACLAMAECGSITNVQQCLIDCNAASESQKTCACICFSESTCEGFSTCFIACVDDGGEILPE